MKPAVYPRRPHRAERVAASATAPDRRDWGAIRRNEYCGGTVDRADRVRTLIDLLSGSGAGEAWSFLTPRLSVAAQPERAVQYRSTEGWMTPPDQVDADTPADVAAAAQIVKQVERIADRFRATQQAATSAPLLVSARFALDVAGELYVWRRPDGTYGIVGPWAASIRGRDLTVHTRSTGGAPTVVSNPVDGPRVWARWHIPDLMFPDDGRSWLLPTVETLTRIRDMRLGIMRTPLSRLGRTGVTWYPAEADEFLAGGETSMRDALLAFSRASITDPQSIAAFTPPVVSWSKEFGPPQHLATSVTVNPADLDALNAEIENFGRMVPAPTGSIVNTGDQPYANALVASIEAVQLYGQPLLDELADMHNTVQFRPGLAASGFDPDRWRVVYTADHLMPRSTSGALDQSRIWSMLPLTREALGRQVGVSPEDLAPLPAGWTEWDFWFNTRSGAEPVAEPDTSTPNGVPVADTVPAPPGDTAVVAVRAAGEPVDVDVVARWVRRAVRADRALVARLQGIGDTAVREAVRKAAARLVSRKATLDQASQKAVAATVDPFRVAAAVDPAARIAAGADDESLLKDMRGALETQVTELLTGEAVAADRASNPDGYDTPEARKERDSAVRTAVELFVTAAVLSARRVINRIPVDTPAAGGPGSDRVGIVGWAAGDTVAAAGGWVAARFDDTRFGKIWRITRDWPEHGTPGLWAGPRAAAHILTGRSASIVYRWEHGSPVDPFEPHAALDGASWSSTSDRLRVTQVPGDSTWPGTSFFPGDHDGCTCSVAMEVV